MKPWSRLAHSAGAYPRFLWHEAARSISSPPGRDASRSQAIPPQLFRFPQQFAGTHLYSWVERGTGEFSVFPKNTTLAPGTSPLTMRPLLLPLKTYSRWKNPVRQR